MTGDKWFSKLPLGWKAERAKHLVRCVDEKLVPVETTLPYIGLENVQSWTGHRIETQTPVAVEGAANLFSRGDLLFGKLRPYLAKVFEADSAGTCSTEFLVLRPQRLTKRYLFYALLSPAFIDAVNAWTYGTKMPRASWDIIGNLLMPVPSIREMNDISAFLDRETASADEGIARFERLIVLLEDKRCALITQAVTNGLDPSAPTKESGIEWIGRIPDHWMVDSVRHIAEAVQTGSTPDDTLRGERGLPWYKPANFVGDLELTDPEEFIDAERYPDERVVTFPSDTVLVVGIGATVGKVAIASRPCTANQQVNAIVSRELVVPRFLAYFLAGLGPPVLKGLSNASTLPILTQSDVKSIRIAFPPDRREQQDIIDHLDRSLVKIRATTNAAQRAVELIREHRSSLVTAAVTGQIDVSLRVKPSRVLA